MAFEDGLFYQVSIVLRGEMMKLGLGIQFGANGCRGLVQNELRLWKETVDKTVA